MIFKLKNRSLIRVKGNDIVKFFNSLTTNNLVILPQNQAIYTCLLTPSSKFLLDFFIFKISRDEIIIDIFSSTKELLLEKIQFYKLRLAVIIEELTDFCCYAMINEDNTQLESEIYTQLKNYQLVEYKDPRHKKLDLRIYSKNLESPQLKNSLLYDDYLIQVGIVSGEMLDQERSFILEYNFEAYNAVDYNKGCYLGQELVTRTKRVGEIRKKIYKGRKLHYNNYSSSIFSVDNIANKNNNSGDFLFNSLENNNYNIVKDPSLISIFPPLPDNNNALPVSLPDNNNNISNDDKSKDFSSVKDSSLISLPDNKNNIQDSTLISSLPNNNSAKNYNNASIYNNNNYNTIKDHSLIDNLRDDDNNTGQILSVPSLIIKAEIYSDENKAGKIIAISSDEEHILVLLKKEFYKKDMMLKILNNEAYVITEI